MFEEEVHQLDILIAAEPLKSGVKCSEDYEVFINNQKQLWNLQIEILNIDDQIQLVNDVVLLAAVNNSDGADDVQSLYLTEIELLINEKEKKVIIIDCEFIKGPSINYMCRYGGGGSQKRMNAYRGGSGVKNNKYVRGLTITSKLDFIFF